MSGFNYYRLHRRVIACVWTIAVAVLHPATLWAQGCAMCNTLVGGPGDPLGHGINTSIFFMMAMPFVLTASVGGWIAYMYWRGGSSERTGVHPLAPPREEVS